MLTGCSRAVENLWDRQRLGSSYPCRGIYLRIPMPVPLPLAKVRRKERRKLAEGPNLESVYFGRDPEVITMLLDLHCETTTPEILDCTHNRGVMWKGIRECYKLSTLDSDPRFNTDYVADFRAMPVGDATFDVLVFDPPHLPVAGASPHSTWPGIERYGITDDKNRGRDGDNVSEMFAPFLLEAKRVLRPGGIILVKLTDIIHNHRYQWQQVDFINAVRATPGLTPCDMLIKRDPCGGNLKSSLWKNAKHLRRVHSYWIVVRKSERCERRRNQQNATDKAEPEQKPESRPNSEMEQARLF